MVSPLILEGVDLGGWCRSISDAVIELGDVLAEIKGEKRLREKSNALEKLLEKLKPVNEKVEDPIKSCWDPECSLFKCFSSDKYRGDIDLDEGPKKAYQDLRKAIETMEDVEKGKINTGGIEKTSDFLLEFNEYVLGVRGEASDYQNAKAAGSHSCRY